MRRILLLMFVAMPFLTMAQTPRMEESRERLEAIQIAFLTRDLNLTSQEAEKFWPVYNRYQNEMKTVLRIRNEDDVLDKQQQVLDIRKKYKGDFTKILGADRTNKLFEAEMRFREMVRKELQNRQRKRN